MSCMIGVSFSPFPPLFYDRPHFPRNPFILSFKVLPKMKAGIFNQFHLQTGFLQKHPHALNLQLIRLTLGKNKVFREANVIKRPGPSGTQAV